MTKRECAIVMAYTGICMLQGDDFNIYYDYICKKLGRRVYTHELAAKEMEHKIKEASKEDFINLCKKAR